MSQNKPSEGVQNTPSDLKQQLSTEPLLTEAKPSSLSKTAPKLLSEPALKPTLSKMRTWLWSMTKYALFFIIMYTVINWWRQPVMPANPTLQLTDYQGQIVDIEALSHKSPVLVYFWGTWCGICKVSSPTIQSLSQSSPYPVVTIATQSGSNQDLGDYMTRNHFNFTTINDNTGDVFSAWHGQVTPSYVVIKNGEMTQGLTGIQPEWSLRLRLWLSSLFS